MLCSGAVRLRRLEAQDLQRCTDWVNDPRVRAGLPTRYPVSLADEEDWYRATRSRDPATRPFAIDVTADEERWDHVGVISFREISWVDRCAEVALLVGDVSRWSRGIGTSALLAFLRWGFRDLGLHRVWLRVYADNSRAIALYQKVGFIEEGRLRQSFLRDGAYIDTLVFGLLCSEFVDPQA